LSKKIFLPGTIWLVLGLGLTCTIGYGSIFYSFSLFSIEFENHFNWSKQFVFGVFSFAVFCSGCVAPILGKQLDRHGTQFLLTLGSLLVALGLFSLSLVNSKLLFIIALVFVEIAGIFVLYESAFVAVTQKVGQQARYPITQITLIAGFASTIFWPLISWLISAIDWRWTYVVLAALHIGICFPVHWWVLKPRKLSTESKPQSHQAPVSSALLNQHIQKQSEHYRSFIKISLAVALGISAFAISSIQIHLFQILDEFKIDAVLAITVGTLIGPSQVAARVIDMLFGHKVTPIVLGIISFGLMALGMLGLLFADGIPQCLWLFAIAFGAGQGLTYIVRGVLPLFLFGDLNYGSITGQLNAVRMILTAIAPFSFAALVELIGVFKTLGFLAVLMLLSIVLLIVIEHRVSKSVEIELNKQ
jgi:MFS family permease